MIMKQMVVFNVLLPLFIDKIKKVINIILTQGSAVINFDDYKTKYHKLSIRFVLIEYKLTSKLKKINLDKEVVEDPPSLNSTFKILKL